MAGRARGIAREEGLEAAELVARDRLAARREARVGGRIHQERRDARAGALRQAAEDEDAGPIEVARVADGDVVHREAPHERDDGEVRLAAGAEDDLVALARLDARIDVVEVRREVLEEGDAAGGGPLDVGALELLEDEAARLAQRGVARDVVEPHALLAHATALRVDDGAEAEDRRGRLVVEDAVDREGEGLRSRGRGRDAGLVHQHQRGDVMLEERRRDASMQLRPAAERLAAPEHAGREDLRADGVGPRVAMADDRVDRADDVRREALGRGEALALGLVEQGRVRGGELRELARDEGTSRSALGAGFDGEQGALEGVAGGAGLGRGIARLAAGEGVEGADERGLRVGARVAEEGAELEAHVPLGGAPDDARGEDAAERVLDVRGRGDGDPRGEPAAARLDAVDDGGERDDEARRFAGEALEIRGAHGGRVYHGGGSLVGEAGPWYRAGVALAPDEIEAARRLRGPDAAVAFAEGAAGVLLRAVDRRVASAIVAERAEAYVTLLYGMLLLRRSHELEPLHEDIERMVGRTTRREGEGAGDEQALARDLDQLVEWGCLTRRAEPLKIRGYKDISRERFRYHLTEDAVALLEWLEARLEAHANGRADDGRDLLIDVLGHLRELSRVVTHWHKGERTDEAARRAMHLCALVDERTRAIGEELLTFRASMLAFAGRPYDVRALRAILAWLERYVSVYLARIEALRADIVGRLEELGLPRHRRALAEQLAALERERLETPAVFRSGLALRPPSELLEAQESFYAERGRLAELSRRIDDSARAVLRKMHRHLREIERRSARVEDLRARIAEIARLDADAEDDRLSAFANALVGSAHARFGRRQAPAAARVAPPLPRKHAAAAVDRTTRPPLRPKANPPDAVRELRARRLAELARWIDDAVLRGAAEARLSAVELGASDSPRRWLDVARARHLDRGRDLARVGVTIADAGGEARLGDERVGLRAPDCIVKKDLNTEGSR